MHNEYLGILAADKRKGGRKKEKDARFNFPATIFVTSASAASLFCVRFVPFCG